MSRVSSFALLAAALACCAGVSSGCSGASEEPRERPRAEGSGSGPALPHLTARPAPEGEEPPARQPTVPHARMSVAADASTVSLRRAGMAIGSGGIAKGYALDR
ncbi:MAG: hypothetical protein ACK6CU_18650, partial [Deltaproteobacteria bacterium]